MEGNGQALIAIQSHVQARRKHLEDILPKSMNVERFTKIVLQSIAKTPKLAQCSPESLYIAMHSAAQLGLEPNGPLGHAFLIPYWNTKANCYECQFQPGWRGLVALADRLCELTILAYVVHKGDQFKVTLGCNPNIVHEPNFDGGDITHVYAVAQSKDGRTRFEVMSVADVNAIKQRTKSKDKEGNAVGPWRDDFGEMARKTVVKRLCKYLPISPDMADAIDADNRADFEDVPEVHSEPTKTRTEQVKEQLKQAAPALTERSAPEVITEQELHKECDEVDKKLAQEPARRGRKPKEQSVVPTQEHKESQPSAAQPAPVAQDKTSGGSPKTDASTAQVAAPATATGVQGKSPATQDTGTGEVFSEWLLFTGSLDIGQQRTKFLNDRADAFYSESLVHTQDLKGAIADKRKLYVSWTEKNGRNIIVDAKHEGPKE